MLTGDNQCYCEGCHQKSDVRWKLYPHKLPPVLNILLSWYHFDQKPFMSHKHPNKICLLHELILEEKQYIMCAVVSFSTRIIFFIFCLSNWKFKHNSNSTDSGDYVTEAIDWTTSLWFLFDDETVTYLDEGPQNITGCTGAYSFF